MNVMNYLEKYTSTGNKLLQHPLIIERIKYRQMASPISVSVAPTSRCNLACSFCSNANREKHEDLDILDLCRFLQEMKNRGLQTVEWTGGGDPTCYEAINLAIESAKKLGLEQGFITNGVALDNLTQKSLDSLKWLRISMNSLDYVDEIKIPKVEGTLGFSYVWNEETNERSLFKLVEYTDKYKPAYVRIVPNCQATPEEQEKNNREYAEKVKEWHSPYFYQAKVFEKPERCWWCYLKPFLLHNEFVYPCSSVVLNDTAKRSFHEKYRWMHMKDFAACYGRRMVPFDTTHCTHCVFTKQNRKIDSLIYPDGMENFI